MSNRFLPSSIGRAWKWWSGGCGFQPPRGANFDKIYFVDLICPTGLVINVRSFTLLSPQKALSTGYYHCLRNLQTFKFQRWSIWNFETQGRVELSVKCLRIYGQQVDKERLRTNFGQKSVLSVDMWRCGLQHVTVDVVEGNMLCLLKYMNLKVV